MTVPEQHLRKSPPLPHARRPRGRLGAYGLSVTPGLTTRHPLRGCPMFRRRGANRKSTATRQINALAHRNRRDILDRANRACRQQLPGVSKPALIFGGLTEAPFETRRGGSTPLRRFLRAAPQSGPLVPNTCAIQKILANKSSVRIVPIASDQHIPSQHDSAMVVP